MTDLFDEVFGEVMDELGIGTWYELYDSGDFDTVIIRIAERMGISVDELTEREDFDEWDSEMAGDL